ncbi:right-handed parallel beta-helix repeat-containing protein [Dyadobacter endophyticus]|uniref:right-handed parallel beta-helix repeat-containing protein n=1 Tax=Dyadobacter TaxID=120831 RepID=UPI003CF78A1B
MLLFLHLTVCSSGAFALPVDPGTIYYVTEFGSGSKSGLSWADASPYPQAMFNNSVSGDEIWVAAGTYHIAPGEDGFRLTEGVKVYGGFAGTEGSLAERDLTLTDNRSILTAGGSNKYVLANSNGFTAATRVDGFTITGGTEAGIFNFGSSPTLVNLTITGNNGVGIANLEFSSPVLINCAIIANTSFLGGIVNQKSSPVLINCTIARNGSGGQGSGIYNVENSSPKVRNSIIVGRSDGIKNVSSSTADIQHSMVFIENYFDSNGNLIPNNKDPFFVDLAGGDFRLQRCSPAVNTGSDAYYASGQIPDISTVTTDLDGNPRFYNLSVVDMGAYEYQGDRGAAGLPGVWYVKEGGTGTGLSWECAMSDLQTALFFAVSGEQIWVAGGIYEAASGGTFAMKEGVKIYGGFAGTEGSLADRDLSITANKSVLRRSSGPVIENINERLTTAAVLDGFTITGGSVGMINLQASPMLVNVVITGTTDGGMANAESSPYLINCAIIKNRTLFGAMVNQKSSPVLINCTIADNYSTGPGSIGVYNAQNSSPIIRNSIIYGNQNGVYNENASTATIEYSLIETNKSFPTNPPTADIDPLFVNAVGGNYRLQPCSPAVNKGFNYFQSGQTPDLSGIITDLVSKPRLAESAVDMGAYEFSGASRTLALDGDESVGTVSGDFVLATSGSGCKVLAYVSPNGGAALNGAITAKVWVAGTQPVHFLKRHYQITPATNAANATAKVTLYFTQQEFTDFNEANPTKLPVDAADVENYKANLRIEKRTGVSGDGSGLPDSYSGSIATFTPSKANGKVEWNADANRWEVSFDVTGFSGFFVKTIDSVLPLHLISFTARKEEGGNLLQWSTASEVNTDNFEIQKSGDAKKFIKITTVEAGGSGDHQYSYNDRTADRAVYYRLKMSDLDGTYTFSKIVSVGGNGDFTSVYPNPAGAMVTFYVNDALLKSTVNLYDLSGRKLQSIVITANQQGMDIKSLTNGLYILKFADGTTQRFVKE